MIVKRFSLDVAEVNAHVAFCVETRDAVLVDAGVFDEQIVGYLREHGLTLKTVFITHDHYDHVDGLADFVRHYRPEVLAGVSPIGGCPARTVRAGDSVRIGKHVGQVLSTPGHTPVALSLAFPGHVFTGDALFAGSVGGTSTQENYDRQIAAVRENILSLPPDTVIHCGHGPASTVSVERRYNPFFV